MSGGRTVPREGTFLKCQVATCPCFRDDLLAKLPSLKGTSKRLRRRAQPFIDGIHRRIRSKTADEFSDLSWSSPHSFATRRRAGGGTANRWQVEARNS